MLTRCCVVDFVTSRKKKNILSTKSIVTFTASVLNVTF